VRHPIVQAAAVAGCLAASPSITNPELAFMIPLFGLKSGMYIGKNKNADVWPSL